MSLPQTDVENGLIEAIDHLAGKCQENELKVFLLENYGITDISKIMSKDPEYGSLIRKKAEQFALESKQEKMTEVHAILKVKEDKNISNERKDLSTWISSIIGEL